MGAFGISVGFAFFWGLGSEKCPQSRLHVRRLLQANPLRVGPLKNGPGLGDRQGFPKGSDWVMTDTTCFWNTDRSLVLIGCRGHAGLGQTPSDLDVAHVARQ